MNFSWWGGCNNYGKKTAGNSAFGIIEDEFVGQLRFTISVITWLDMKERLGRVWDDFNILNLGCCEAYMKWEKAKKAFKGKITQFWSFKLWMPTRYQGRKCPHKVF